MGEWNASRTSWRITAAADRTNPGARAGSSLATCVLRIIAGKPVKRGCEPAAFVDETGRNVVGDDAPPRDENDAGRNLLGLFEHVRREQYRLVP